MTAEAVVPPALIPFPRSVSPGPGGPLTVDGRMRLTATHVDLAAVSRLITELLGRQGITLEDEESPAADDQVALVRLELSPATAAGSGAESYALTVGEDGVVITAPSPAGVYYGAQSLAQLLGPASRGPATVPALDILDSPRFRYRGAMLDVARHFFDVATVKAYIERIARAKLNHLHLHLTDDQGWRVHIESWPLLTERGATGAVGGSPGGFYTQDEYREIVAYAAERFVTIVPEIDLPGHTHAAIVAYPQLAPAGYAGAPGTGTGDPLDASVPTRTFPPYDGTEVGFSSIDTGSEEAYGFVTDVVRELAALTPGPYLHLGGDESLSTTEDEYLAFLARASRTVAATGKTPVFWHEAGASRDLPSGTVGQYWDFVAPRGRSAELTRRFAENGGTVILSPADAIYLDMKHSDGDERGLTWADGPTSVEAAYSWEPADVVDGLDPGRILGVEAPLWSETIDALSGIDALAFPRLLAAAEVAWSPHPSESTERTWSSFRRRLVEWQSLLDELGVGYTRAEGIAWT
jgi:hexosaminidase